MGDFGIDDTWEADDGGDMPVVLPGAVAWNLWSTYGLPIEITRDICKERGFVVDEEGYEAAKKRHQAQSQQRHEPI